MSRLTKDTQGIVGLTISQIGLFCATAILLAAVISSVFFSAWQRTNELRSATTNFSTLMQDTDVLFFDQTIKFLFPERTYPYSVHLSPEYCVATAKDFWGSPLYVGIRFLVQPWIRCPQDNWTTGRDLHEYLSATYGHSGYQNDSLSFQNMTYLLQERNSSVLYYAAHPLEINTHEPVFIEKVIIYYDDEWAGEFLLVYQLK
jgi:hypothetical protein